MREACQVERASAERAPRARVHTLLWQKQAPQRHGNEATGIMDSLKRMMRTFRLVAQPHQSSITLRGAVAIDVTLRGQPADVAAVAPAIRSWLEFGCELDGAWVDRGTNRHADSMRVPPWACPEITKDTPTAERMSQ